MSELPPVAAPEPEEKVPEKRKRSLVQKVLGRGRSFLNYYRERPAYSFFVVLPTLLLVVYYLALCTDRYVSHTRLIVERDPGSGGAGPVDLGFFGLGTSQSTQDAQLVKTFIESPAMISYLDEKVTLRAHYTDPAIDRFSRLSPTVSREKFLSYFLDHINIELDEDSTALNLDIQGFDPAYAQKLAKTIVERSEMFVNDISQALAREQLSFVKGELDVANSRLQAESAKMRSLQNENKLISPELESASVTAVIGGLQQELARQKTELTALQGYLSSGAQEVASARNKVAAIEQQIARERSKQVNTGSTMPLNDLLLQFQEQQLNVQIAQGLYQAGLQSLESARLDASRKVKHLVMVSAPTLPQASEEPRRLFNVMTMFVLLNLAYFVGRLTVISIRDHRD